MSTFHSVPDIIQSSVSLDIDDGQFSRERTKYYTSGTIYPLATQKSFFKTVLKEISNVTRLQQSKKILTFLVFNFICTFVLLIWCHTTNSMALTAYTYLTMFDCLSLLVCLLTLWVQMQKPTSTYSFGYERYEVLGVFASTMLAQLGSLFILKESVERMFIQPDIHTGRLLIGTLFAFFVHFTLTYSINNRAMNHVVDASSSSWLQEHMTDMSESVCHIIPGLSKLLLPRINPMALIGFTGGIAVIITHILIDTKLYHSADTWAAVSIAIMTCGTMFPLSAYTGKILLQTTPSHLLSQLDKIIREASTLDGVLEFRHEHFWTLSFGTLAGSVQVRVRRDADEQMVLAHVYSRLSSMVSMLTIQIFKDDWTRASGFSVLGSPAFSSSFGTSGQYQQRGPSPILDSGYRSNVEGHGHSHSHGHGHSHGQGHGHSHGHGHGHSHGVSSDFKSSTPTRGVSYVTGKS